jgi:hypothetical protein
VAAQIVEGFAQLNDNAATLPHHGGTTDLTVSSQLSDLPRRCGGVHSRYG